MKSAILILLSSSLIVTQNKNAQALEIEKIINGTFVEPGHYTYQVYLNIGCGGAIIAPRFVVTAAHCIIDDTRNFRNTLITMVGGTVNLNEDSPMKVIAAVEKVFIPMEFPLAKTFPAPGDLAVLRLDKILDLGPGSGLSKLELPPINSRYRNFTDKTVDITGFGVDFLLFKPYYKNETLVSVGNSTNLMKHTKMVVRSDETCKKLMGYVYIPGEHICAQSFVEREHASASTCDGDSGGALVYKGKYIIGVLSNGAYDCDEVSGAGIYTFVIHHRRFFNRVFKDDCSKIRCKEYRVEK